jgi:fibronectin-binding autotransporter adhesin
MRTRTRHLILGLAITGLAMQANTATASVFIWTGVGGLSAWSQSSNWVESPPFGSGTPSAGDTASFQNIGPTSTVYLGTSQTVATLDFSNTSARPYTFNGGTQGSPPNTHATFSVGRITHGATTQPTGAAGSSNTINSGVTLQGPTTGSLSIDLGPDTLTLAGPLVAPNGVNLSSGTLILGATTNASSAVINMNGGTLIGASGGGLANVTVNLGSNTLYLNNTGAGGTSPGSTVNISDGSSATITTFTPQLPNLNVLGGLFYPAWNLATLNLGNGSSVRFSNLGYQNTSFANVNLNGPATVNFGTGAQYFSPTGDIASFGSISENVAGSALTVRGGGRLTVTGPGSYTGGTIIGDPAGTFGVQTGAFVDAQADGALGSGPVTVNSDSAVRFSAPQTHLPTVTVAPFGAIGGNLTGAVYGSNVILSNNAVLFPTAGTLPATLSNYWRGVDDATGSYTVGGSGYKGAAFGTYTVYPSDSGPSDAGFVGTLNEASPGQGIEVYTSGFLAIGSQSGAHATFNTTTGVEFTFGNAYAYGSPEIAWFTAPLGTARTFTFNGPPNSGYYQFAAEAQNVIPAGYTLNINHGQFWSPYQGNAVGGTVNINTTGSLYLVQPATTGTFHVLAGGTMFINSQNSAPGSGATFHFDSGSQLELESASLSTGSSSWVPTTSDITLAGSNNIGSSSDATNIVLDSGRQVVGISFNPTLSGQNITSSSSTGSLTFAAQTGQTLTINNNVSIPNGTLQIGETNPFLFHDYINPPTNIDLGGTVVLTGQINVGTFSLASGSLQLGAGSSVTINQTTVNAGSKITGSGTVHAATLIVYGTISPGDPATFTNNGNTILQPGGNYDWQVENTTGQPGNDWDLWRTTGSLTIDSTSADPFVINVESLASNGQLGLLGGFNPADNYSWEIMSVGGLPGFDPSNFAIDTSEFDDSFTGSWSISAARGDGGDEIVLNYTAPEPAVGALLSLSAGLLACRRRNR